MMKMVRVVRQSRPLVGCLVAADLARLVLTVHAARAVPTQKRTVWQGVYTPEQADRGRAAYLRHCAACHGADLGGGSTGGLIGEWFIRDWSETSLFDLFDKIRATMPPNLGRNLDDDTYGAIVAYVLQQNAFPSGSAPLSSDAETLRRIRIERRDGPAAVSNFALVKIVGCLARRVGDEWLLTHASDAARTRFPDVVADPDRDASAVTGGGNLSFQLFGIYPAPDAHLRHQVEVRGLLIRTTAADRINVTSLRSLGAACATPD